jgi:MSHA biogenesis protein MshI
VKWLLGSKNKHNDKDGFVAIHETPTGISMAYTIPGLQINNLPVIKAQAFVPALKKEEKQHALAQFVKDNHLENVSCTYIVSVGDYNLILLEAPPVTKEEFSKAAVWLLKDMLSFPTEEAIIDTFELPAHRARDNIKMIYAVVIHRKLITQIHQLISGSKLKLTHIDIPEFALRNIEKYYGKDGNGIVVFQLYPAGGKLLFCKEGNIYLARSIDLKLESLESNEVGDTRLLELLSLEVQRSFDYLSSMFRQAIGSGIVIFPTLLNAVVVKDYLTTALGIEVEILTLSKYIMFENKPSEQDEAENLLAIGGVLREITESKV